MHNHWENFVWWLDTNLGRIAQGSEWKTVGSTDPVHVSNVIKASVSRRVPVLIGTAHARTGGHVILVVGYETLEFEMDGVAQTDDLFVCHDPFGDKDRGIYWNAGRWKPNTNPFQAYTFPGEDGPGRGAVYDLKGISRAFEERYDEWVAEIEEKVRKLKAKGRTRRAKAMLATKRTRSELERGFLFRYAHNPTLTMEGRIN